LGKSKVRKRRVLPCALSSPAKIVCEGRGEIKKMLDDSSIPREREEKNYLIE
jgi:hypothetical protein